MVPMKMYCAELIQAGQRLYFGAIKAGDVAKLLTQQELRKDEWAPTNQEGYQRGWSPARSRAFAKFLADGGVSPSTLLLNVRSERSPKFERLEGNYGVLHIPDKEPLWIVDGQHRVEGVRMAVESNPSLAEYDFPVMIMHAAARYGEAEQFYVINQTLRRMRTDLAERFLRRQAQVNGIRSLALMGKVWVPKAIDVVDLLNATPGPWLNRIRMPNQPKAMTMVSQKSLTDSFEPILTHKLFEDYNAEEIAEMLSRYWQAIMALAPEAAENPFDYVLQKGTGVLVLHRLFPHVAALCTSEDGRIKLTVDRLQSILERTGSVSSNFWVNDGEAAMHGTSRKAVRALALDIKDRLPLSEAAAKASRLIDLQGPS